MSLMTSHTAADRTALPAAGPFRPARPEVRNGGDMRRAVLTSILALYPVLAALAVVLVSMTLSNA